MFFKRIASHFANNNINEPKLSHLAKACFNIVGDKFAKVEEIIYANWVQKELTRAGGTNAHHLHDIAATEGFTSTGRAWT